ncbi:MAG: hypothetical protein JST70_02970 [Bacteroidetes bacterium]|nr:hypothetical protein [Bacteroidota bacterium]
MTKSNDKIRRVFYHELGHFVAGILNNKLCGEPKPVKFYIEYNTQRDDYTGGVTSNKNISPGALPIGCLSKQLVSLVYGCMFQFYLLDISYKEIDNCFNGGNGKYDADHYKSFATAHISTMQLIQLREVQDKYFEKIFNEKLLEEFRINHDKYLVQEGENYTIDIKELEKDLQDSIEKHLNVYKGFVTDQQDLINSLVKK